MRERPSATTAFPAAVDGATAATAAAERVFAGGGEMRALCRAFDWASTPLGRVEQWSRSLRTTVTTLLASGSPMFLWWGPELIQIYNDAYRPSLGEGGRHPRALGMRGRDFWTDTWEVIGPQIAQVMRGGDAIRHEDSYIPIERNGQIDDAWWTYSYSPVLDDDGSIGGTLVVCQETTNRILAERERERLLANAVRAEHALSETAARYRALLGSIDEGFCVVEVLFDEQERAVDYRFVEINPAFAQQTGLEGAAGRRMRELAPSHEEHWFEIYGRVALTGEPVRFEAPADSLHRWFDVYALRVGRPEERKVAILFTDVTEAKAAERERERLLRALEVERARLSEVFRRAPSFIVTMRGPELRYEFVNEAYYQLIGDRDVIGKPLLEAIPEIGAQQFEEILDQVRKTGEPWVGRETPVQLQRTPGAPLETRYLDVVFQALAEANGTRSGVVAHGHDVTEQVLARREVERLLVESEQARADAEAARAEAETANRAKSEFLAIMSHELRTPLNAIAGYTQLMELGIRGPVTAQQREDLNRIQSSQRHLQGLINEVLNYAKLESGSVHYDLHDIAAHDALRAAEALVEPQARGSGLRLIVADCPPELRMRADTEKLRQVLVNLLSNAVKFTRPGGEIRMWCEAMGDEVSIRVSDTGMGIPADKLDAIFDPFIQVHADFTRQNEGTGLGLAISRDLARGMGGDLTVESTQGEGSTFTLTLPRA
ncbi:MAG TPA: ATP-binding protein [Gemmatimonadaceae bacterium]|nr:ATP-binding protein [Gemmatimonadaceae bacterium]